MDEFYETVTTFCFTLQGLWWGVVQFRHDDWMPNPQFRRLAYGVYLSFLLPGIMSLGAMLSGETRIIWQLTFAASGGLGALATIFFIQVTPGTAFRGWFIRRGRWAVILLYALVTLVAIRPDAAGLLGLAPLQLEGLLLTILVLLGVEYAWEFMAEPKQDSR